jgi:tripartite-type tricarboxylate transporter receptor subunit TctC
MICHHSCGITKTLGCAQDTNLQGPPRMKQLMTWMQAIVWLLMAGGQTAAWAQDSYPARPITLINPWAAGSSTDIMARAIAEQLFKQMGQSVVVVSRDGGSGVIGMTVLMQAPADGLTLAFTPMTPVTIQPHHLKELKLSPDTIQPVCGITENILGLSVRSDSTFKTLADLIAAGKSKSLSYGSPGPNSAPFLAVDDLGRHQKLDLVHIPFKGDAASIQELLAGRLDFATSIAASAAPQVKAGSVRLLAVASERRHPGFPEVPTLRELGIDVTQLSFAGLFAPKGTPPQVLAKLDAACAMAVKSDAVKEAALKSNQILAYQSMAQWDKRVHDEFVKQGAAFRAAGGVRP